MFHLERRTGCGAGLWGDPQGTKTQEKNWTGNSEFSIELRLPNLLSQVKGPTQSFQSVWPLFMNANTMNLPPGSVLKNWASCSWLHQPLPGFFGGWRSQGCVFLLHTFLRHLTFWCLSKALSYPKHQALCTPKGCGIRSFQLTGWPKVTKRSHKMWQHIVLLSLEIQSSHGLL